MRKVQTDYRRKTEGTKAIKCQQLFVNESFEIVDVTKSQIQAYFTDMMHVTVLATTFIVPIPTEVPVQQPATKVAKTIPAAPVKEQKKDKVMTSETKPVPVVVETKKRTS